MEIDGTPLDWIIASLFVALGIGGLLAFQKMWRGKLSGRLELILASFSPRLRKSVASVIPLSFGESLLIGLLYLALLVAGSASGPLARAAQTVATVLVPAFLLTLIVFFTILLFGRPKFLMPPYLRDHAGWIGDAAHSFARSRK